MATDLRAMLEQDRVARSLPPVDDVRRSPIDRTNRATQGYSPTDFPAIEPGAIPPRVGNLAPPKNQPAPRPAPAPAPRQQAPVAAAPAPAPMQVPAAPSPVGEPQWQGFDSSNPSSEYDDDLLFSRLVMSGLQQIGDSEGYNQFKGAYADALTKRYGSIADSAIQNAQMGDFSAALAAYNHLIPNNRKVVGYSSSPDGGLLLKFDDGSTQARNPNQLMGLLTSLQDPKKVLSLYETMSTKGYENQLNMQRDQAKAQLDTYLESHKAALKTASEMELKRYEQQIKVLYPEAMNVQKSDDGTKLNVIMKDGSRLEHDLGSPLNIEGLPGATTTPSSTWYPAPRQGGPQPQVGGWSGSLTR